ncbi:thermonuclease family protein [Sulfurimonas sp.]
MSNEKQKFGIENYTFECQAYGVLALETLYYKSKRNSICQKSIDAFYKRYPKKEYFVNFILKDKQLYHIQNKEDGCVVYAKGQITLSELLLKEGLAIKKPIFKDEEFQDYYTAAQRKAKMQKKGLWGTNIFTSCVPEL